MKNSNYERMSKNLVSTSELADNGWKGMRRVSKERSRVKKETSSARRKEDLMAIQYELDEMEEFQNNVKDKL